MEFLSRATTADGVSERLFSVDGVPGLLWSPADADDGQLLVLLAHGGGQHKRAPGMLARAHRFVSECGFAVVAIDAPGFGDRPPSQEATQFAVEMRELMAAGKPAGPHVARHNAAIAAQAVPEWQATIDALLLHGVVAPEGPVGFWGVSMGAAIGVPLVAADARITAAVVGLLGIEGLVDTARAVQVPLEFLLQWDDEFVPRESALALFEAFGSVEKTLHANPGRHGGLPLFEMDSALRFFRRHFGAG